MSDRTEITLATHVGRHATQSFPTLGQLYRNVYAEPPYHEGESDAADFEASLEQRSEQPEFRVVVAHESVDQPIGFALGHRLEPGTKWWRGALTPLPERITEEHRGRTFAIIELAVLRPHRQRGLGRALHDELVAGLDVERLTLLVRPDAVPAAAAYRSWGYERVGQIQPFPDGPVYDAMVRTASREARPAPGRLTTED